MKVAVLDINGKDTGRKADLSNKVFAIEPNNHAVYLDVKQYLANQRQGTHKAKERAEIVGSTRKIKKQKGTAFFRQPLMLIIVFEIVGVLKERHNHQHWE